MAVDDKKPKQPTMIRDYWPRFRRYAISLTILMQMVVTLAIGLALIVGGVAIPTAQFWITLIAIFVACVGLNILLITQLSTPLKDLTSAITHISNEPSQVTPPNPNARHFERDGFKPILQLIYELASDKTDQDAEKEDTPKEPATNLSMALNNTAAGFIIMNTKQEVFYANSKAPVHTTP
ncbi:MAG TPA: hypothetical protein VFS14_02580, partial [Candidatus Saccharimonadales bacterium]|nr:hypothetical protein [Candidatus Saccharimonadales bacterium]